MATPTDSDLTASARRSLFTTSQAAHVILGGTDTATYWGVEFKDFVLGLEAGMNRHIGNPAKAPWREQLEFSVEDYVELAEAIDRMDFVRDPVSHMDEPMAIAFARRSEILGMHGPIGAGKDTVANALKPYGFVSQSFADPLKVSVCLAYGVPLRYMNDRDLKHAPIPGSTITPRKLMQLWGTEVCRGVYERVWIKRALLRAASPMHDLLGYAANAPERLSPLSGIRLCIPDARRSDEADFIRSLGGRIVIVERPDLDLQQLAQHSNHATEAGISRSPTDIHVVNEGPMEEFQARVGRMLAEAAGATAAPPQRPASRRPKP